jgi:hypothetical protein
MHSVTNIVATLAGAVLILGGVAALIRALFKFAVTMRDNTVATKNLTGKLEDLTTSIDGRFDLLAERVAALERRPAGT